MTTRFRVELAWRYRRKPGGVLLGLTLEATSPREAIGLARARHIKPYPSRRFVKATARPANADD